MNKTEIFGDRKFVRALLSIAVPMMMQQLITNFVNLLDNLMVGQLGKYAISGVATANRFFMIGSFAMMGITSAASIFIAQFYGSRNRKAMQESFRYSITGSLISFLPFFLAALVAPGLIIRFFNEDPLLLETALEYMPLAALSFIPLAVSMASMNAMRSVGETKLPLKISIVTVFSNAFFNYILIFGHLGLPAMGVRGAAMGTLLARIVEVILVLVSLKRSQFMFTSSSLDLFSIPRRLVAAITRKSLPLMVNEIGFALGLALLYKFYATRGADVMTAISINSTTADLFFVLFGGMAAVTTVFVSQHLGHNELQEAKQNAYRILRFSLLLAVLFGVVMFALSFVTPRLYDVDSDIQQLAAIFIRIQASFFWVYMINTECYFILRAGGDMRRTMMLDSGYMLFINIPVVAALAYFTSLPAPMIYLAGQTTDIIKIFFSLYLLRKETWLRNLAAEYEKGETLSLPSEV